MGEEYEGRCGWSRLDRLEWRRRGGGGGGGGRLVMLSPEALRGVWCVEEREAVRLTVEMMGEGGSGLNSRVLRREDGVFVVGGDVRVDPMRWGSSEVEEFTLVLVPVMRAPWRERGGGGGDFTDDVGSGILVAELDTLSMECCDDIVREELLRERFDVVEARS